MTLTNRDKLIHIAGTITTLSLELEAIKASGIGESAMEKLSDLQMDLNRVDREIAWLAIQLD